MLKVIAVLGCKQTVATLQVNNKCQYNLYIVWHNPRLSDHAAQNYKCGHRQKSTE